MFGGFAVFGGFAGSWGSGSRQLRVCGEWGFEQCNSEKTEQRFKDASSLIFLALMCLTALSLKLPT